MEFQRMRGPLVIIRHWGCLALLAAGLGQVSADTLFSDPFKAKLGPEWRWVREDPSAWRLTPQALEIRIQPGNMWGPENSAKNVLVHPVPRDQQDAFEVSVTVENRPTEQYEQVDLVWYHDDSHQVKIGQEQVDGVLSIVMGREEKDRTRTINIIPIDWHRVDLKLVIRGNQIEGWFRNGQENGAGDRPWRSAGQCDLPPIPKPGEVNIAIECYQGPRDAEHWAKIQNFELRKTSKRDF